jgi:hypothetical protein
MRIGFSPKWRGIPEYEAFGTSAENTKAIVMKSRAMAAATVAGLRVSGADGFDGEKFRKLGGSQIRAKFVSMEMTDNVHWADVLGPNGGLRSYSMGRKKDGKRWIEKG